MSPLVTLGRSEPRLERTTKAMLASTCTMNEVLRYAKIAGGFLLLAAGIAMIALPGPGWLTIAAGLAILAGEFIWARRLLDRLKYQVARLRRRGAS